MLHKFGIWGNVCSSSWGCVLQILLHQPVSLTSGGVYKPLITMRRLDLGVIKLVLRAHSYEQVS